MSDNWVNVDSDESYYKQSRAYQPCNIYKTAKIGKKVNIGAFTEIGDRVVIGDNVRIGAMCFIPAGVTLEDNAWIGPRVTFTNDMYPPSGEENWKQTIVKKGARIGAAVTILPGITIGEKALVGAGAVVTHDIPAGEVWSGVPARKHEQILDGGKLPPPSTSTPSFL